MTSRNLQALLRPRSVALVGATDRAESVGRTLLTNLLGAGFAGPVWPVNPNRDSVLGIKCYRAIADLPEPADLAVVATPAASVPQVIAELAARGTRGAVVISAGFADHGAEGRALERATVAAGRDALLRIVGPNTLGVIVPALGLNASFAHLSPRAGGLAFVAQSGAVTTSVLDWAVARGIGFSHVAALGDMADVDFGDLLDYLADDAATTAVLLYVEAIAAARKFMSAARAAARSKPVLVVKGGRHSRSAGAAASHTGRLAGPDREYDAAFRRAGMLRVGALDELFDAVETLALARPPRGPRLAIVTNGGGLGVLAADALLDRGGELAGLSDGTAAQLDAALPAAWSHGNPIDIVGDARAERFAAAVAAALDEPQADAVLVLHCPTAMSTGVAAAEAVAAQHAARPALPLFTSWLGEQSAAAARAALQQRGVPTYATPEHAVRAFMQMVDYRRNQELLLEAPAAEARHAAPDRAAAARVVGAAAGREWLADPEARALLAAYGVPIVQPVVTRSPEEAGAAAARLGGRVVLKILSSAIQHKSDVGGVALGLAGAHDTAAAASAMRERVRRALPEAAIDGFTVEPQVDRSEALELIIGASSGGDFGPVVLFGEGGKAVEVIADTALELVPLNVKLALELMRRTRVFRRMRGYRDVPAVDVAAVADALVRLSQLLVDWPQIVAVDVNPLLASERGVVALDARVQLAAGGAVRAPLAICPYPRELERELEIDGRLVSLRPIRPEDETALQRLFFACVRDDEARTRFFRAAAELPHRVAARFTQIDYDRELTFVACDCGLGAAGELVAIARLAADPERRMGQMSALLAPAVRAADALALALLAAIVDHARVAGFAELRAELPPGPLSAAARTLGFAADGAGPRDGVTMRLDR